MSAHPHPTLSIDPIAGPRPRSGLRRLVWKWRHGLRQVLWMRGSFKVDGVYYKELNPILLNRALSERGPGVKEFRITFPDRSKLIIHCTPQRVYADVCGPALLGRYRRVEGLIRPGMRLLDACAGTGYGAAWLSDRVGPSGAVVAIERDLQSVEFAQRRYPLGNVAFEVGDAASLSGETDGSFDGAIHLGVLETPSDNDDQIRELWRVVRPGGWLLLGPSRRPGPTRDSDPASSPRALKSRFEAAINPADAPETPAAPPTFDIRDGTLDVLIVKPEPSRDDRAERDGYA